MKSVGRIKLIVGVAVALVFGASDLHAKAFLQSTNASLVVVRLGDPNTTWPQGGASAAVAVYLDEYDVRDANNPVLVNTVALPSSGSNSLTMSSVTDHGNHLHLSTNKQYLTLAGFRCNAGWPSDPGGENAQSIPRVIGRIDIRGNIDTSTALTDDCNYGPIRGVVTDDGTRFWTGGDNASGANDGGLRFALLGATTSNNLSHNQVAGSSGPTTDNVRDVGIAGGQLYVGSGSAASIGKTLVRTNVPLPTSGSQNYTPIYTYADAATSFIFLDLNPAVPGVDTLYTGSSNPTAALRKYSLDPNTGNWISNGFVATPDGEDIDQVTAMVSNGRVVIFAGTDAGIYRLNDTGYNQPLVGPFSSYYITPGTNEQLRGIELLPVQGDANLDGVVNFADFAIMGKNWLFGNAQWANGDFTGDKTVNQSDLAVLASHWLDKAGI